MTALAIEALLAKLSHAGLRLALAPAGGLAVAPSKHLTADLRDVIRSSKALLINWLTVANYGSDPAPDRIDNPLDWKAMAADYHAHHFSCAACIAAGRSPDHGTRCCEGLLLWDVYQRGATSPLDAPTDISLEVTA